MFRKLSMIALAAMLALTMLLSAPAETIFEGGSGTAEDPWQIATAEQLDRVRDDLTAHYILTADIDLSGYENWEPIGAFQSRSDAPEDAEVPHPDYAFTGTFMGDGHTISNLTVASTAPMGAGLFGCASGTERGEPISAASRWKMRTCPAGISSAARWACSSWVARLPTSP